MQSCPPSERHRAFIAQMPKSICTFTGLRKLYLRSSDLSDQTQSQAQDETESDEITRIQWLSGKISINFVTLLCCLLVAFSQQTSTPPLMKSKTSMSTGGQLVS